MAIGDYDTTASNNSSISGTNIGEGCAPGNINNAIRQIMADIATDVVPLVDGMSVSGDDVTAPDKAIFHASTSGNQTLTADTWVVLQANSETFDRGSDYNTSTYTFTTPVTGIYLFGFTVRVAAHATTISAGIEISAAGSPANVRQIMHAPQSTNSHIEMTLPIYLAASTAVRCMINASSTNGTLQGGAGVSNWWGVLL